MIVYPLETLSFAPRPIPVCGCNSYSHSEATLSLGLPVSLLVPRPGFLVCTIGPTLVSPFAIAEAPSVFL